MSHLRGKVPGSKSGDLWSWPVLTSSGQFWSVLRPVLILLIYFIILNKSQNLSVLQFPHLENTFDTFSLTISRVVVRIKQHKYVKMLYNCSNEPSLILSTLLARKKSFHTHHLIENSQQCCGWIGIIIAIAQLGFGHRMLSSVADTHDFQCHN